MDIVSLPVQRSSSYHSRYLILASLSALLAFSFHAGVNRRFSLMEDGLKAAATIRYALEWDELMELEYHNEAYKDNQESIHHLLLAFEFAHQAHLLQKNITRDQNDIKELEEDAQDEKKKADEDETEASMWAIRAFGDGRATSQTSPRRKRKGAESIATCKSDLERRNGEAT